MDTSWDRAFVHRANSVHPEDKRKRWHHLNYRLIPSTFFLLFGRLTRSRLWWLTMRRTPMLFSFTQRMDCSSLERVLKRCSMWRSSCLHGSALPGEKYCTFFSRALRVLTSASPAMSNQSRTCTSKQFMPSIYLALTVAMHVLFSKKNEKWVLSHDWEADDGIMEIE